MITWWLRPESVRTVALIRIGVGLLVLHDVLQTWRYSIELYSTAGPAIPMFSLPPESGGAVPVTDLEAPPAPVDAHSAGPRGLEWPIPSPQGAVLAQSLLVFTAAGVVLGWQTRVSLLLTAGLLVWLRPLDLSWTCSKITVVWLQMLGLLLLSECGRGLSLDAAFRSVPRDGREPALSRRLLQLLVCHIYLGAALTKLKSPWFVGGELLQFSLLDLGWGATPLGQWLATSSVALRGLSLATVLFELLFPFLVWVPRLRPILLGLAVLFHLGIWITMHVGAFSPSMLVLLLAFVDPDRLVRFPVHRPDPRPHLLAGGLARRNSAGLYLAFGLTVVFAGGALQEWFDWYGVFGRRSLPPLTEVAAGTVQSLRLGRQPALEDYVHRVTLGNWRGERDVWGDPHRAFVGGRLYVLVQFTVPHPDLRLEGLLLAPDGRLAARFERRLDAGYSYAINGFELTPEVPPGTARVILQLDGYEFTSRSVEIVAPE